MWLRVAFTGMSVTLWLALLVQLATLALLRLGLGRTWLRRPGTILVLASVIYDGVIQVLLSFPSVAQWDTDRYGIASGYEADAALLLSAGMLAYAIGFLVTGRGRRQAPSRADVAHCTRVLDWRLLALASVPLAVLAYEGRGYNDYAVLKAPGMAPSPGPPPSPGVASVFLVIVVTLAAVSFLLRHGPRAMVPVLAVQSLVLAAAGERTPVIAAAAALVICCAAAGMRPSRRQVTVTLVLTALAVVVLSGAKAAGERMVFEQDTGLAGRLSALRGEVTAPPPVPGTPGVAGQAALRLDGTSFTAAILQARALGDPLLPASAVPESLLTAVPKALWPSKPDAGYALSPYDAEQLDFGLALVNILPTVPGLYAGYMYPAWLIAFLAFLGLAWGLAERWMLARVTPARLVLLAGAVQAAVSYEGGLPTLADTMRSAAGIAVMAWGAGALVNRASRAEGKRQYAAAVSDSVLSLYSPRYEIAHIRHLQRLQ